ncbi:MAG: diacylglycerol kinase, partial [Bacteroidales bacterium]|nr:diacylglycerol kinase [Bacteroidales bacterium]
RTADFIKAERDDRKRDIKDLGAAAVLVCAITAAITGIIIFLPKLIALLAI